MNTFVSTTRSHPAHPAHRAYPLNATIAAIALLLLAIVAAPAGAGSETNNGNRGPDLGEWDQLQIDAGHTLAFHAYAAGVQIYRWNGASWAFVGPEALLFAAADHDDADDETDGHGVVGIHYGGPTWESNGGSTVVGAVVDRCTPDPTAIDWLKLKGTASAGPGVFDGVTFIQRVNTVGGKAPATPGAFVGAEARVPYTAEYFFYRKAQQQHH